MKKRGGARSGAGRKSKANEEKAKELIRLALKKLYNQEEDDENTVMFLNDFAQTTKGQQFIAEHLLGKPKDIVENTLIVEDSVDLSIYKVKDLKKSLDDSN